MKSFIKERNPFLLISFIISIIILIFIMYAFSVRFELVRNLMPSAQEYYYDLATISFYTILFIFYILASLFNMIGYIYKKQEYILIATILLVILSYLNADGAFITYFVPIIWSIINIIGLIKNNN